jgi:hypothetical protein
MRVTAPLEIVGVRAFQRDMLYSEAAPAPRRPCDRLQQGVVIRQREIGGDAQGTILLGELSAAMFNILL